MARENQGLQIALVSFILTTVLFAVTTVWCFQSYKAAATNLETQTKMASDLRTANTSLDAQYKKLKRSAGFAETDSPEVIETEFNNDMKNYASTFEEENRVYRKVVQYLSETLQKKNTDLAREQDEVKKLHLALATFEDVKKPQIDAALKEATQYGNDLKSEQERHTTQIKGISDDNDKLLASLQKSRKEAEASVEAAQAKQKDLEKQNKLLSEQFHHTRETLEKVTTPTFEVAQGAIRWADQRAGTVWINLGRADSLKRQTTFSVYSSDINDVTKAGRKGTIEITEILGEHMAEARIVEDKVTDPITPGDVIHTPVWTPGHHEHFALAGFIDVNGDTASDREMVKNLLTANGAVVDAEVDDQGNRSGDLSADTHYLIEGTPPGASADQKLISNFSAIEKEAQGLGVRTIKVDKLLQEMGYKDEARVAHFGKHVNAKEFPARTPDGVVPRASTGTVSPLYMDKQKPKSTRGSAF